MRIDRILYYRPCGPLGILAGSICTRATGYRRPASPRPVDGQLRPGARSRHGEIFGKYLTRGMPWKSTSWVHSIAPVSRAVARRMPSATTRNGPLGVSRKLRTPRCAPAHDVVSRCQDCRAKGAAAGSVRPGASSLEVSALQLPVPLSAQRYPRPAAPAVPAATGWPGRERPRDRHRRTRPRARHPRARCGAAGPTAATEEPSARPRPVLHRCSLPTPGSADTCASRWPVPWRRPGFAFQGTGTTRPGSASQCTLEDPPRGQAGPADGRGGNAAAALKPHAERFKRLGQRIQAQFLVEDIGRECQILEYDVHRQEVSTAVDILLCVCQGADAGQRGAPRP